MKLSQYKEKENHRKLAFVIVAITFLIGGVILEKTFANFKVQKSFKVMEGNFIYEGSGDVIFAFYNGNESLTQMPQIDDVYTFEKGECDKGASIEWNSEKWAPLVMGLKESKTTCKLYFKEYPTLSEYLIELAKTKTNQLVYDGKESLGEYGTDDNNLRFFGANPDNYVTFNNEKWRIIGVMNNVEDENGNKKSHVKITRDTDIGGYYSWDSSPSNVNNGWGVNEWSKADIQKVLNENYYKKEAGGTCYNGYGNSLSSCPKWEKIGIDEEARKMVSKVKWPIGTIESVDISSTTPAVMYKAERGGKHPKLCSNTSTCNDEIERTTSWPGYVGLPSITDLAFAPADKNTGLFYTTCVQVNLGDDAFWINRSSCHESNYLSRGKSWLLNPRPSKDSLSYVASIEDGGYGLNALLLSACSSLFHIYPTIFLDSDVRVRTKADDNYGSSSNPFQILMKKY